MKSQRQLDLFAPPPAKESEWRNLKNMIATSVGDFVNAECSDCGGGKVKVAHWGPCVPEATRGKFCDECWQLRVVMKESAADPKPLGYRKVV